MKTVYDLTVAGSKVVHGVLITASTRLEWVRSRRETIWMRASIHVRKEVDVSVDERSE